MQMHDTESNHDRSRVTQNNYSLYDSYSCQAPSPCTCDSRAPSFNRLGRPSHLDICSKSFCSTADVTCRNSIWPKSTRQIRVLVRSPSQPIAWPSVATEPATGQTLNCPRQLAAARLPEPVVATTSRCCIASPGIGVGRCFWGRSTNSTAQKPSTRQNVRRSDGSSDSPQLLVSGFGVTSILVQ